ncbi:MAG: hypothetical protein AAF333_00260 [Planctomycetota bacterium]
MKELTLKTVSKSALIAAAAAASVSLMSPAPAQTAESIETQRLDAASRLTPLTARSVRNQPVTVGRFADYENSPGLIRTVRTSPALDERSAYSKLNRFDRSDRWYARELARGRVRLTLSSPLIQQSLNPDRLAPGETFTVTNPDAVPQTVGPVFPDAPAAGDASVYALRPATLTDAEKSDPWALLDRGLYRDAIGAWEGEDAESRTGRALAYALSGDLAAAADLMPANPSLPAAASFSPGTIQRITQSRRFVFSDDPVMQAALQAILDTATPAPGDGSAS